MLQGFFDAIGQDAFSGGPVDAEWCELDLGDTFALAFRLQVGPDMLCWLIDPSERALWQALDAWNDAGKMVVAAEFPPDRVLLATYNFKIRDGRLRAIRNTKFDAEYPARFLDVALTYVTVGGMKGFARSCVPTVASLKGIQACVVAKG